MIDPDGYRPNIGIVLANDRDQVLWARRISRDGWQFPQGGMNTDEVPEEAMYRELHEETGLTSADVAILGSTRGWLRYRLPSRFRRRHQKPVCIGQKQVWFLLRLVGREQHIQFDVTPKPEFDRYRWVDYWHPVNHVVYFKRNVYKRALRQLAPCLEPAGAGATARSGSPAR